MGSLLGDILFVETRNINTTPNGSQMPCGCAYRLVTLMTTSTSPTRIHLSGMSSKKPCAMMSVEISEVIVSFIAISFSKTRCLPDSGFCFTPSEIAFFGASPRRHAPRFHFISEICGTGAGGACGEEETATMDSSLQTTLKNYQHRLLRSVWIVRMASQISSFFSGMKF